MPSISDLRIQPGTGAPVTVSQTTVQGLTAQTNLEPTNQTASPSTSVSIPWLARLPAFDTSKLTMNELLYLVQNNADVQMSLAQLLQTVFESAAQAMVYTDGTNLSILPADATVGGSVAIKAGNASALANGGNITLQPGSALGTGKNGNVIIESLQVSDPNVADAIWSNGGLLTRSNSTGNISVIATSPSGATAGATVSITSGNGSFSGGNITLTAGTGGSGNGGAMNIYAGTGPSPQGTTITGGNSTQTNGTGGNVTIQGGSYDSATGNSCAGGWAIIFGGNAHTQGNGGDVRIKAGTGAGTGTNGNVYFTNLPIADPHHNGAVWNNNGVMTISAG